ncbi:MAG: hypothetical protein ABL982_11080 [Vicinamibacterales bacterium]
MNERKDLRNPETRPTPPHQPSPQRRDGEAMVQHFRSLLDATKRDAMVRLEAAAQKRDHTSISSST